MSVFAGACVEKRPRRADRLSRQLGDGERASAPRAHEMQSALGFGFFLPPGRDPFLRWGLRNAPYGRFNWKPVLGEGQGRKGRICDHSFDPILAGWWSLSRIIYSALNDGAPVPCIWLPKAAMRCGCGTTSIGSTTSERGGFRAALFVCWLPLYSFRGN